MPQNYVEAIIYLSSLTIEKRNQQLPSVLPLFPTETIELPFFFFFSKLVDWQDSWKSSITRSDLFFGTSASLRYLARNQHIPSLDNAVISSAKISYSNCSEYVNLLVRFPCLVARNDRSWSSWNLSLLDVLSQSIVSVQLGIANETRRKERDMRSFLRLLLLLRYLVIYASASRDSSHSIDVILHKFLIRQSDEARSPRAATVIIIIDPWSRETDPAQRMAPAKGLISFTRWWWSKLQDNLY